MKVLAFDNPIPETSGVVADACDIANRQGEIEHAGRLLGASDPERKVLSDGRIRYIWRGLSDDIASVLSERLPSIGLRCLKHNETPCDIQGR